MPENGHGGSAEKPFNADGNSGAARHGNFGLVKKVGGMLPEALGPRTCTLLGGQAALALESVEMKDMRMNDGQTEK